MDSLPRREREVLETVLAAGETAAEPLRERLGLSSSATRTLLARLERKGLVQHRSDGARFLYTATPQAVASRDSVLERVVKTFFGGSAVKAALALLGNTPPTDEELHELESLLEKSREAANDRRA